ncbi:MAG: ParB/RepB/Spo0J family partition protein [Caldilineaceae bacterium]
MTIGGNAGQRRGLGRGLGALIMNTQPASDDDAAHTVNDRGVQMVSVSAITPNPHQPRTHFDPTSLQELASSIQEHGIIQPLIVTQAEHGQPAQYWIVAGERRWRAAKLAGQNEVPVIVREASTEQLMEWALVENIQRADLNPLEEAAAYQALMDQMHLTQAEVAKRVGKSRSAVANTVRLLNLSTEAQGALLADQISAGHARAIVALAPDQDAMQAALDTVLSQDLTVRQTEELVRKLGDPEPAPAGADFDDPGPDALAPAGLDEQLQHHVRDLENRFRNVLGTRVSLNRNRDGSGRLVVHFFSDEELAQIYQVIARDDGDL